jgi:hypothetical protein
MRIRTQVYIPVCACACVCVCAQYSDIKYDQVPAHKFDTTPTMNLTIHVRRA